MIKNSELIIERKNIKNYTIKEKSFNEELNKDEILIKLNKFGLTSNNVTYVILGESYKYFDVFPSKDKEEAKLNVWGLATIIKSNNDKLLENEQIYGYFPCQKYYKLTPSHVNDEYFMVKRSQLPADYKVYNQYFRSSKDFQNSNDENTQNMMLLYRPLFWTSFFIDDYLNFNNFFGTRKVLISSASSKTAFCLAHLLKGKIQVHGVTSKKNYQFVKGLGLYDNVILYENFDNEYIDDKDFIYINISGIFIEFMKR
jgi:hypothetical protein